MKILLVDMSINRLEFAGVSVAPQIGASVDMGYLPCPRVKDVTYYPKPETLKRFSDNGDKKFEGADAIVFLE